MLTLISMLFTIETNPVGGQSAAEVWQSLRRLNTTGTVLHTTAHPDDEDGALLTWLSRGQGIRTGLFSLTRGEGGANLIGPELFDALGILRTEEQLVTAQHYDVDLFFGKTVDFGYSKRLDESIEKWGHHLLLEDTVRIIRTYRPQVIIARFAGNSSDGHGHHQASGVVTREAFSIAADPTQFPEQIRAGLHPWQAQKLYTTRSRWRRNNDTEPPDLLRIDTGEYDSLLGYSYHEISRRGLSYQRSQGAGQRQASRGSWFSSLQLVDTILPADKLEKGPFDGIDTTIMGMSRFTEQNVDLNVMLVKLQRSVEDALVTCSHRQPWASLPYLAAGLRQTRELIETIGAKELQKFNKNHLYFLLKNKEQEFMHAANKALGISMEVLVDPPLAEEGTPSFFRSSETFNVAIPGQVFTLTTKIVNPSPLNIELVQSTLHTPKNWGVRNLRQNLVVLGHNGEATAHFEVRVPEDVDYSQPYWSRQSEYHDDVYMVDQPKFAHLPFQPPEVLGVLAYRVEGSEFKMTQPAQTVRMIQPWGERRRLLAVAPALSLTVSPSIGVIPVTTEQQITVQVEVLNNVKDIAKGKIHLQTPKSWVVTPNEQPLHFTHEGEIQTFPFQISIPMNLEVGVNHTVQAMAEYNGQQYTEGYQIIDHRDLEPRHLYRPASMELRTIDVKVKPSLKLGYIMGVGDKVPQALEQLGIKVQILGNEDLAFSDLSLFDTIVVGIRAYAVRVDLKAYNRRLLDYVHQGGNLIVQYQTPEFDAAPYGPYPYKMGRRPEEVSEEDAKVTILEPDHPMFKSPNQITPSDFDGWVEERGSKFLAEWDSRYKPLLSCNDKDQEPQSGGLLVAHYGAGIYTYAAYAFYRQLPAGISGAYRLFSNLISSGGN